MMTRTPILRAAAAAFCAFTGALMLTGCNTTKTSSGEKAPKEEYIIVEETGSHIKKRIKKSEYRKHVGTSPSRKTIVTDETDTTHIPTPTALVERGSAAPGT